MASSRPAPVPIYVLRGLGSPVHSVGFTSSSSLLTGCLSGAIRVWSLRTLRPIHEEKDAHSSGILGFCMTGADSFWSHGRDGKVCYWSLDEGRLTAVRSVRLPTIGFCQCETVSIDDRSLLCGPWDSGGEIALLDSESGNVVAKFKPQQSSPCGMCMAVKNISQPGHASRLLSAHEDGHVRTWDLRDTRSPLSCLQTHTDPIFCCAVDSSQTRGLAAGAQNCLVSFSLDGSGQLTLGKKAESPSSGVTSLAVRTDAKLLLAGLTDGRVMAYSWKSLKPLAVLCHHQQTVHCVVCAPAGSEQHVFAAGSKDSMVSLWSLYK